MEDYSTERTNNKQVKVYPLLGKAVLRVGAASVYRAWLMLRNAKPHGYQWHTQTEVISTFAGYGLSRSRWYSLLDDPHFSTFFTLDERNNRLFLRGLLDVCQDLETLPGTAVWVEGKKLHRLVGDNSFQSAVYAARYNDKPVRLGRDTIAEETGVSRTSQWRYEKAEGVKVEQNYESVSLPNSDDLSLPESMAGADGWYFVRVIDGQRVLIWQTVNTYTNGIDRARRGMARKVSNAVRRTLSWAESERRPGHFIDFRDKTRKPVIRGTVAIYQKKYADIHPVKKGGHCIDGALWERQTVTV